MDVEILLHGVTNGQSFIGIEEERQYAQLFYGGEKDLVSFTVENRNTTNGVFCYYTYKRAGNVIGYNGRTGSYMAITLRIDRFYADVVEIYRLLELTYKKFVVGNILEEKDSTLSYKIADFAEVKSLKENIESFITSQIRATFVSSDLKDFDDSICHKETKSKYLNILDCDKASILSIVRQTSKIVISPYYDRISESNSKIEYQNKCVSLENLLKQKDSEQSKLSSKNNELIAENKTLKDEVQRLRPYEDVPNMIKTIKEPIERLAKMVKGSEGTVEAKKNLFGNIIMALVTIFVLITLVFCVLNYVKVPNGNEISEEMVAKSEFEELQKVNGILNSRLSLARDSISTLLVQVSQKNPGPDLSKELKDMTKERDYYKGDVISWKNKYNLLKDEHAKCKKENLSKTDATPVAIKIKGPDTEDLIVGQTYQFEVTGGHDAGKYAWHFEKSFTPETGSDIKSKIIKLKLENQPENGTVTVSYGTDDQSARTKLTYKVKKE
ncbi:MAG: hypothetical protein MJ003_05670 [Paludibacteraceae bacterium]|nr:hypothetical protein [Paludibacteraceae bacterium]